MTPIGEQIGYIVAAMRETEDGPPYYMYGHRVEINARLLERDKFASTKDKKYPLIILILDIPEGNEDGMIKYTLHLAIIAHKDEELNAEQRMTTTIEPVLYELYENFIGALVDSGYFTWPGDPSWPAHTKWDRPKWGLPGNENNESQHLSDKVDAIEIVNLAINQPECHEIEPIVMTLPEGIVIDKGGWNPQVNGGMLPTTPDIQKGWEWHIVLTDKTTPATFASVVLGVNVDLWDGFKIRAKVPSPGQNIDNYYWESAA